MTDAEVAMWRDRYKTDGVFAWVCAFGDVESYFCEAMNVSDVDQVALVDVLASATSAFNGLRA